MPLFVTTCRTNGMEYSTLLNSASAPNLISPGLVERLSLTPRPLTQSRPLLLADGSLAAQQVTHSVKIPVFIPLLRRQWAIHAFVLPMPGYDLVLGLPWISGYSHLLDWSGPSFVTNHPSLPCVPNPIIAPASVAHTCKDAPLLPPPLSMNASPAANNLQRCNQKIRSCLADLDEGLIPVDAFPTKDDPPDYCHTVRRGKAKSKSSRVQDYVRGKSLVLVL